MGAHWKSVIKLFLILTVVTFPVDRWSKDFAREKYLTHEDALDSTIYQGAREEVSAHSLGEAWYIFQLTYVRNHGASWGVLKDLSHSARLPTLILSGLLLISGLLAVSSWLWRTTSQKSAFFMITITSGAIGNLWDRINDGYVTDLFALKWSLGAKVWSLPAFNIADIIIVSGLFGFIISIVFVKTHK